MDSLKGTLISIVIFFLMIVPILMDVMAMGIVNSQLNKVGAEMIQVVGSSSEYDERTEKAIEIAERDYGIEVSIEDKEYSLGDTVEIQLKKNITHFFMCEEDTGREGCNADYFNSEKIMITKRSTD